MNRQLVPLLFLFCTTLAFSGVAHAQATKTQKDTAKAFCVDMNNVLNKQDSCDKVGRNFKQLLLRYEAFLSTPEVQSMDDPEVKSYCDRILKEAMPNLARCADAKEMADAVAVMDEMEANARRGKKGGAPLPKGLNPGLLSPDKATAKAPATFKVRFDTTKGPFVIQVERKWAPIGADRFYNLVKLGYYNDTAFFRAIDGFMVQFGIHGYPRLNEVWRDARLLDDPNVQSNLIGTITFAHAGPNTRTTQLFINTADNTYLDRQFAPFGRVISGMDVVKSLYTGYGEGAPRGKGPDQGQAQRKGNAYLKASFPELDYIKKARIQ